MRFQQVYGLARITAPQFIAGLRVAVDSEPDALYHLTVRGPKILMNRPLASRLTAATIWQYIPDLSPCVRSTLTENCFLPNDDRSSTDPVLYFAVRFIRNYKAGLTAAESWNDAAEVWPEAAALSHGPAMIQFIDLEKLLTKVKWLCEECPDFKYDAGGERTCSNSSGGCSKYPDQVGCLIGQALRSLGFEVTARETSWTISDFTPRIRSDNDLKARQDRLFFLANLQSNQDSGCEWEKCWEEAVESQFVDRGEMFYVLP